MSSLSFSRIGRQLILIPLLNTIVQTLGFQNLPMIEDNEHKYQAVNVNQSITGWSITVLNPGQRKSFGMTFERYIDRPELLNHILSKVIAGIQNAGSGVFSINADCTLNIVKTTSAGVQETLLNRTVTATARNLSGVGTTDMYFFNFDQVSLQKVLSEFDRIIITISIGITNNSGAGQTINNVDLFAQIADKDRTSVTFHLEPYRNLEGRVV